MNDIFSFIYNLSKRTKLVLAISFVAIVGFLTYLGSSSGAFIWDDEYLISQNRYVRSWEYLPKIFTEDFGKGGGQTYGFYRPMQSFVLMLAHSVWGLDVQGYHLISIVLHSINAGLIVMLVYLLFDKLLLAFLTSLLFVVHPVHTEAVNYISGLSDPLGYCFMLLAAVLYVFKERKNKDFLYDLLVLIFFLLGLLSKELVIMFPAFIVLFHFIEKKRIKLKSLVAVTSVIVLYFTFRLTISTGAKLPIDVVAGVLDRVPGMGVAFLKYMQLLFWAVDLHMEYGQKLFAWTNPLVITGWLCIITCLVLAFKYREKNPLAFISCFWFFLMFLPVSNLVALPYFMAEHYLYMPSLGAFMIVAAMLAKGIKGQAKLFCTLITVFIVATCILLTQQQHHYWKNPEGFYTRTLEYAPFSGRMLVERGKFYYRQQELNKALKDFNKALSINPNDVKALNNIGVLLHERKQYALAVEHFDKALQLKSGFLDALNNRGSSLHALGDLTRAKNDFEKVLAQDEEFYDAQTNLAVIYASEGKLAQSTELLEDVLVKDPHTIKAYYNLSINYRRLGRKSDALNVLHKALEYDDNASLINAQLAWVYYHDKKYSQAVSYFKKAKASGVLFPSEMTSRIEVTYE